MIDDLIIAKPGRAQVDESNVCLQDVTTELAALHLAIKHIEDNQGGYRYWRTALNQVRELKALLGVMEQRMMRMRNEQQAIAMRHKRERLDKRGAANLARITSRNSEKLRVILPDGGTA